MRVLFVHGMGRTPLSGWPLLHRLRQAGLRTTTFGYTTAFYLARYSLKLSMYENHLGKDKAEKYVLGLCKRLKIPIYGRADLRKKIDFPTEIKRLEIDLTHEVIFTMKNGRADVLQNIHDAQDRFLSTPISIGTSAQGLSISMEHCGHVSLIDGPGFIEAPEVSFSKEIILYRQEAMMALNAGDWATVSRYYRSFLQNSVSLVECFLHRYTFHVKYMIPSMESYENTAILDSRVGLEARLEAWMKTFAFHRMDDFKQSSARSKFIEIKDQRNSIVHPSSPTIGYSIKTMVKFMNFAQQGIGGLLADLREYSGTSPDIGFIQQMKTLPEIRMLKKP